MKQNDYWLLTNSGKRIEFHDPDPEAILIQDIAHGLSLTCRWAGQCKTFYSVAQHSLMISKIVPESDALWGLLHDAAEAYLTDLPRPLKECLPKYRIIEAVMLKAIAIRFGLPESIPDNVKKADNLMLSTEAKLFMNCQPIDIGLNEDVLDIDIMPLEPEIAERMFLERYKEIIGII